jgi:hypothetical protein
VSGGNHPDPDALTHAEAIGTLMNSSSQGVLLVLWHVVKIGHFPANCFGYLTKETAPIEPLLSAVMRGTGHPAGEVGADLVEPRIHPLARRMDCRVMLGNDNRVNMTGNRCSFARFKQAVISTIKLYGFSRFCISASQQRRCTLAGLAPGLGKDDLLD